MTFKVKANPTFDATLTIIGQGREQKLNLTYRHKSRTGYGELLEKLLQGGLTDSELALELVEKWDADVDLDKAGLELLEDQQPGATRAIIEGYSAGMQVARRKN
jgi:hypothetical protein